MKSSSARTGSIATNSTGKMLQNVARHNRSDEDFYVLCGVCALMLINHNCIEFQTGTKQIIYNFFLTLAMIIELTQETITNAKITEKTSKIVNNYFPIFVIPSLATTLID